VSFHLFIYTSALSEVKSHPLYSGAIRAGFKIGRLVYKAGRARKLFRRDLEFDEDLEMREPIKGARTAMSVTLLCILFERDMLKSDSASMTEDYPVVPTKSRVVLIILMIYINQGNVRFWKSASLMMTRCSSVNLMMMRSTLRGSLMILTDGTWACNGLVT